MPTKYQLMANSFVLHAAPDGSYARAIDELTKVEIGDLLKDIKGKVAGRSALGLRSLCKIFKAMDEK